MSWTDERVDKLKKLWADGLSASQIARSLGEVTRNAVIGKVHRLGLSGRATTSRIDRPRSLALAPPAPPAPRGSGDRGRRGSEAAQWRLCDRDDGQGRHV